MRCTRDGAVTDAAEAGSGQKIHAIYEDQKES